MKRKCVLLGLVFVLATGVSLAASQTEKEVKQAILDAVAYVNENSMTEAGGISKEGSMDFWSSGGLMQEIPSGRVNRFESVNIKAMHIRVISLVEGEAAVAMYYSQGSMKPENAAAVTNYLTRVTQVFVKEDGEWKIRSAHWSPIIGGSGTSQTAVEK